MGVKYLYGIDVTGQSTFSTNVGIGTLSPNANLDIAGGVVILGQNKIDGSSDNLKIMSDFANISGSSTIEFSVDNSEKMRITNAGNVGIGTTSPTNKLHVEGRIEGDNFVLGGSDSTVFYGLYRAGVESREVRLVSYAATPSSKVQLGFNDISGSTYTFAPALTAMYNGNVGIGTTSPGQKLDVNGAVLAGDYRGSSQVYLTSPDSWIFRSTDGSERLRITSSGNVGIGTTSPSTKLDVLGDVSLTGTVSPRFRAVGNSSSGYPGLLLSNTTQEYEVIVRGNDANKFQIRNTTASTDLLTITSTGNVGIGTTNPSRQLEVSNTGNAIIRIAGDSDNDIGETGDAVLEMTTDAGGHGWSIRSANIGGGTGDFKVNTFISSVESTKLLINRDGNVGIGTTSPSAKLDVEGTGRFNGNLTVNGEIYGRTSTLYPGLGGLGFYSLVPYLENANQGGLKIKVQQGNNLIDALTLDSSQNATFAGDINIINANLSNQENLDVDTGTEVIAIAPIALYTAAFFDFVVKNGANVRSGTVYACHDGTSVEYTETSTADLGNTSAVVFTVDISAGNMRLLATTTTDNWSIKTLTRTI